MASGTFSSPDVSASEATSSDKLLRVTLTGPFVARVVVQESLGQAGWRTIRTFSGPAAEDITAGSGLYRLACETLSSGSVNYSFTAVAANNGSGSGSASNSAWGTSWG